MAGTAYCVVGAAYGVGGTAYGVGGTAYGVGGTAYGVGGIHQILMELFGCSDGIFSALSGATAKV